MSAARRAGPDDRADPDEDERIRRIVDQWFPLTSEQMERLSLLLNPGARDD
jgi:hypothetical protein